MAKKNIKSEKELSEWFIKNHKSLGYSKIIRNNNGRFPDFIMERNGKEVGVELETLLSNFNLHRHDIKKVDEVVCIKSDIDLAVKIVEINELNFTPRLRRVSFTIDPEVKEYLDDIVKRDNYRNRSHAVESVIRSFENGGTNNQNEK